MWRAATKESDYWHRRLLRLGRERRERDADSEDNREPDPRHEHLV